MKVPRHWECISGSVAQWLEQGISKEKEIVKAGNLGRV